MPILHVTSSMPVVLLNYSMAKLPQALTMIQTGTPWLDSVAASTLLAGSTAPHKPLQEPHTQAQPGSVAQVEHKQPWLQPQATTT
jgi:hypothetical protein